MSVYLRMGVCICYLCFKNGRINNKPKPRFLIGERMVEGGEGRNEARLL